MSSIIRLIIISAFYLLAFISIVYWQNIIGDTPRKEIAILIILMLREILEILFSLIGVNINLKKLIKEKETIKAKLNGNSEDILDLSRYKVFKDKVQKNYDLLSSDKKCEFEKIINFMDMLPANQKFSEIIRRF
jgi:hypothetical protein